MSMMGMGLNNETLNELSATEGTVTPNDMNAATGPTVVVNFDTQESNAAGNKVIDNFDDFDIVLQEAGDAIEERVRLEDVAQVVMAAESISYSDVQNLLNLAGSDEAIQEQEGQVKLSAIAQKLDDKVPLASYTDGKSAVNLEETKKFFKKELQLSADRVVSLYTQFYTNKAEQFKQRAKALIDYIDSSMKDQTAFAECCAEYQLNALKSENYLAYMVTCTGEGSERHTDRKLYDLRHIPFTCYSVKDIIEFGLKVPTAPFIALGHFLKGEQGTALTETIRRHGNYDISSNTPYYRTFLELNRGSEHSNIAPATYADLLAFFAAGEVTAKMTQMRLYLEQQICLINVFQQACLENKPAFFDGKEYNFEEAITRTTELLAALCQAAEFVTIADNAKDLATPVFIILNDVIKS